MAKLLLYGEHELTFDDKNRLLIPSDIRRQMNPDRDGEAFFLVVGVNRKPWLYPERFYESLVAAEPTEMMPALERLQRDQLLFGLASRLDMDKQGRVLVPEKMMRRAALAKEVCLVGVRDHLEIWNRPEWESWRDELMNGQQGQQP